MPVIEQTETRSQRLKRTTAKRDVNSEDRSEESAYAFMDFMDQGTGNARMEAIEEFIRLNPEATAGDVFEWMRSSEDLLLFFQRGTLVKAGRWIYGDGFSLSTLGGVGS